LFALVVFIWSYPVLLTLMNAFKEDAAVLRSPLTPPWPLTFAPLVEAWNRLDFLPMLKNTLILSLGGSLLSIVFAAPPAYVLSRFRLPAGEAFFVLMLTGMMLPQQAVIIPLYDLMRDLRMLDSLWGLAFLHGVYGLPFTLLFLRGFMATIPVELEDAARVDGATDFTVFTQIILPLAAPGLAVVTALNLILIWNEFFFALIFLESSSYYPLTVWLLLLRASRYFQSWNIPAAAVIIGQAPTVLLYTLTYRFIQRGLVMGGVKG
jgi:ABC-type glycerol-3-phosphate transport system permease component